MIWILAWFLGAALLAPVLGKFLHRCGEVAETNDLVNEIERYLECV